MEFKEAADYEGTRQVFRNQTLPTINSKRGELLSVFEESDKLCTVDDGTFEAAEGREPAKRDAAEFAEDKGM